MSKSDQHSKVSLEDLLRLKRAERPSPEFWSKFETELRQKQLTALVQKRRWWHEMAGLLNRRIYLPAGAAALVALTMVTVRYSVPLPLAQASNSSLPAAEAGDQATEMLAATEVSVSALVPSDHHEEPVLVAAKSVPIGPAVKEVAEPAAAMSLLREVETPSSRALVANLSRLEQAESDLADAVMNNRLTSSARVHAASAVESEMASMTAASASKYRLIARYADRALSPAPAAPAVVRERLARRLGDDLGDDISRVGVVGSRVSLKF